MAASDEQIGQWRAEYVEHMYPDETVTTGMSQRELDAMVHTARVRACWIVEALMERGELHGASS